MKAGTYWLDIQSSKAIVWIRFLRVMQTLYGDREADCVCVGGLSPSMDTSGWQYNGCKSEHSECSVPQIHCRAALPPNCLSLCLCVLCCAGKWCSRVPEVSCQDMSRHCHSIGSSPLCLASEPACWTDLTFAKNSNIDENILRVELIRKFWVVGNSGQVIFEIQGTSYHKKWNGANFGTWQENISNWHEDFV